MSAVDCHRKFGADVYFDTVSWILTYDDATVVFKLRLREDLAAITM